MEETSREKANKMKKKEKKKKTGKKHSHWGQAVSCSGACLGGLTIWLMKFSKPETNHSKNLIKIFKEIVYYFYENKVVCLQFYNHFFISSFSHNSSLLLSSYSVSTSTMLPWTFEISHALNKASIIISLPGLKLLLWR